MELRAQPANAKPDEQHCSHTEIAAAYPDTAHTVAQASYYE